MEGEGRGASQSAPAWIGAAKASFPTCRGERGGREEDEDHTDDGLLRAALDAMEEHPDANCAGEAVQYLFRLSCNIAGRRTSCDTAGSGWKTRRIWHTLGRRPGGTLAMDAMGWEDAADGSSRVLPEGRRIGTRERCGPCRIG